MADRQAEIHAFLAKTDWASANMTPLAGDASSRRYFRLVDASGGTAILMDAPVENGATITPFLNVGTHLSSIGLTAPDIYASDMFSSLIVMEDLGDGLVSIVVEQDPAKEQQIYSAAVDVLVLLDQVQVPDIAPVFDVVTMCDQISPVYEWYVKGVSGTFDRDALNRVQSELETVLTRFTGEAPSFLLRDFHAENLIWLPDRVGIQRIGLLDFQDAMSGLPGYDLVSLLMDARRDVSADTTHASIQQFVEQTGRNAEQFSALFAALGAQRNLRILGIFARLCILGGKGRYIDFIPRVWAHLWQCLDHPVLACAAEQLRRELPYPSATALQRLRDQCLTQ